MSTQTIIISVAVVVILLLAVAGMRGGPRVTEIDRTVQREEDSE